ncbi:MAG: iron-sulfur cluster repair di-iron protein, ric [Clostridiales bacterium]|nr:iron-sulfur cluster repair di-iron protein, ric [Clostridiales bacterium]
MLTKFNEVKDKHFKTLDLYAPIVARVHGGNHPEFYKVHEIFKSIKVKLQDAKAGSLNLHDEFAELRKITNDYTIPEDVCESYEAVYKMLEELDKIYNE